MKRFKYWHVIWRPSSFLCVVAVAGILSVLLFSPLSGFAAQEEQGGNEAVFVLEVENPEHQQRFQQVFGQHGYTMDAMPSYDDLKALGWNDFRIWHAALRLAFPTRAIAFEQRFDELFEQRGYTMDAPPTEDDLRQSGWTDVRILRAAASLKEFEVEVAAVFPNCCNSYAAFSDPLCANLVASGLTDRILMRMCNNGSLLSWMAFGFWDQCHPCSLLEDPDQPDLP